MKVPLSYLYSWQMQNLLQPQSILFLFSPVETEAGNTAHMKCAPAVVILHNQSKWFPTQELWRLIISIIIVCMLFSYALIAEIHRWTALTVWERDLNSNQFMHFREKQKMFTLLGFNCAQWTCSVCAIFLVGCAYQRTAGRDFSHLFLNLIVQFDLV